MKNKGGKRIQPKSVLNAKSKRAHRPKCSGMTLPKNALADLGTIFSEPLEAPITADRLTENQIQARDNLYRERGEALANEIFELAHKQRSTDLELYLDKINAAALNKPSIENQAILLTARRHFRETFGQYLREHGLSTDMQDQILHRTGKQALDQVSKALNGFDAEGLAKQVWEAFLTKDLKQLTELKEDICGLTDMYVRELRAIYNTLPLREVAQLLHAALHETNLQGEPYPNAEIIRYTLQGRTIHEIRQLEFQFNSLYQYVRGVPGEPSLRQQIKDKFSGEALNQIESLLKGFNSAHVAHEVHRTLSRCGEVSEEVLEGTTLHPDFAGSFRRSYNERPCWERELRARDAINELLCYLTPTQFKNVNVQLKRRYAQELTPQLYTCNRGFNPRRIALQLQQSFKLIDARRNFAKDQEYLSHTEQVQVKQRFHMCTTREITELIRLRANEVKAEESKRLTLKALKPLEYLTPHQVLQVREQFHLISGASLETFVQEGAARICRGEPPKYVALLISSRLGGYARLKLKADLADIFAFPNLPVESETHGSVLPEEYQTGLDAAKSLRAVIEDKDLSLGPKSKKILDLLRHQNRTQLTALEKAYLESSPHKTPLAEDLEKLLSPERLLESKLILCGFDPRIFAKRLGKHLDDIFELLLRSTEEITLTAKYYQKEYNTKLSAAVVKAYRGEALDQKRILALSVLYAPTAAKLKESLSTTKRIDAAGVEALTRHLSKSPLETLAFESAYNRHFARFEYCYQKNFGTLLQRLRVLATKGLLSRSDFAKSILLLEALDPNIATDLNTLIADRNISTQALQDVHTLLRRHRQDLRTIAKAYNALNQDRTLREAFYELKVPLNSTNKTLLLLDGFDPDEVAAEIQQLIETRQGEELGREITALLADPRQGRRNPRIPRDPNWTDEMYHQIRISYESLCGEPLLHTLKKKGVPYKGRGINATAYQLYGELSKTAVDIHRLLNGAKGRKGTAPTEPETQLLSLIEEVRPSVRERLVSMYDAYFGINPALSLLRTSIKHKLSNPDLQKRAFELLDETYTYT
ncbi:MAG: hypothetical protein GX589_00675 [Deltaproteobacteria bacterium]|nr:hypothetical protein [Deltaproteobacteria bacterium]